MNKGFRIYWIMPLVLVVVFLLAMREAHAQNSVAVDVRAELVNSPYIRDRIKGYFMDTEESNLQTPITTKWETWIDPPKNTVVKFTEWGNSIKIEIYDMATPPKLWASTFILKSAMMKTQVDTVKVQLPCVCPPPIDCSKWSTYIQTNATLAQTIDKLNAAVAEQDRLIDENVKFKDRYSDAVREMQKLQARIDKDTLIFIKVDKSLLKPKN